MRSILFVVSSCLIGLAGVGPAYAGPEGPCEFDGDMDTVPDCNDNCLTVPNGPAEGQPFSQCDTDQDGYGNWCDGDINNDGIVGGPDYGPITANFGGPGHPTNAADTNCDTVIGGPDYGIVTRDFGDPPGPSGLSCAGTAPCP